MSTDAARPEAPRLADEATDVADLPVETPDGSTKPLIVSFGTTAAIQLVQAGIGVLLARVLGPAGRGELAAIILWPTLLATLGSLGIYQATTYYAARSRDHGALVGSTLAFLALDAALLVGIGVAILPVVLGNQEGDVVATGQIFLAAYLPLTLLAMTMLSILNGMHRFGWFQVLRVLLVMITFGLLIGLLITDELTIDSAVIAYIAGSGTVALLATVVVVRGTRDKVRAERPYLCKLLSFGLKSQLSVSMWNVNERGDQLVLSAFFNPVSLGLYVVAVTMTSLTTVIGFSFALVALPLIARAEEAQERRRISHAIVGATLFAGALISIPLLIAEPWLIRGLFGEEFEGAVDVGRVLLIAAIFFGLNRVLEAILQALGRPLESSIGESIALVCTAVGLAVLLPTVGILGAGITSLIAYAAAATFLVRRVSAALDVSPRALLTPDPAALRGVWALVRARARN